MCWNVSELGGFGSSITIRNNIAHKRFPFYSQTDTCTVFVNVDNSECKIIFDDTSSAAVKKLLVRGRYNLTSVPDVSNAVDTFTNLEALTLRLLIHIDRSRLSPFKKLSRLTLELFSNIQFDVDTFLDLNNLEELTIKNCNVESLPAGIFRKNRKIRHLSLYATNLTNLHPDVIEKLRNLEEFYLQWNELRVLPASLFRNNEKLRILVIRYNELEEVHADLFKGLANLENLDLSYNDIEHIPSGLFRSNLKLMSVNLSHNKVRKVEVDLTTMLQLSLFYLKGNDCLDKNFDFREESVIEVNENIRRNCTN